MDSQRQSHLTETDRLLDVKEAAEILDVSEKELWELLRQHQVPAHTIAGAFVRFRKEDIEALKIKWRIERELFPKKAGTFAHDRSFKPANLFERAADFWYFNDFYVICSALILVLLYFIVATQ